ncbi:cytochrome P450 [Mytilinidion resinicola]|uniref:Cytochrome P450 n=1 Tax=Mytilinidion resinicola TaxID=574789 RepID=A0A6A6YLY2_9PEZI|nr:cytochrome P450 [Mytilinidion resinicola]KAF2808985.1 cytochrome P450 [Mytilinidion resinicola]
MAVLSETENPSFGGTLAILLGGCVLVYYAAIVVYRLYFHPLAKYPGPFLARISPIPITISLLRGRIPFFMKSAHDNFGPIVRVSPNELCFDEEMAWKDIYSSRPADIRQDPIHVGSIAAVPGVSSITMANDMDHTRQRRALSQAFSTKALPEQEYPVMKYINIVSDKMRECAAKDGIDFRYWVPLISESIKAGAIEQATRRVATAGSPPQTFLQSCIPGRISETRQKHLDTSREKILNATNNPNKDFLYYVMKQQDKGELNLNEVIVNDALFIIAGTETTAGFLTGLFNLITRPENQHILSRLKEEIRSNFKSDGDLNFEDLVKLPYMTAVIDEGLRMFPSAPIGFVRTVPAGGDTVCGHFIPEGFDRENPTDKLGARNAFSLGPRGCIGRNLSYMEMRLIMGKLLWHNDVEMHGDNEIWNPAGDYKNMVVYKNWIKPSLNLRLTPRKF